MSNVRDFGARGDGQSDDTQAIQHAVLKGDGRVFFPRGDYLITRPIQSRCRCMAASRIDGEGGDGEAHHGGPGAGAAPRRHAPPNGRTRKTSPRRRGRRSACRRSATWRSSAGTPQADGIRVDGVMQPTLHDAAHPQVPARHPPRQPRPQRRSSPTATSTTTAASASFSTASTCTRRTSTATTSATASRAASRSSAARSATCRFAATTSSTISTSRPKRRADVFFDCRDGTVREGTLVGNTIQAKESPGGANVRFLGAEGPSQRGRPVRHHRQPDRQPDDGCSTCTACRGVVVSGNSIYSGYRHAIWAEDAEHLVIGANSIDHNPEYRGSSTDQVVLRNCRNVNDDRPADAAHAPGRRPGDREHRGRRLPATSASPACRSSTPAAAASRWRTARPSASPTARSAASPTRRRLHRGPHGGRPLRAGDGRQQLPRPRQRRRFPFAGRAGRGVGQRDDLMTIWRAGSVSDRSV